MTFLADTTCLRVGVSAILNPSEGRAALVTLHPATQQHHRAPSRDIERSHRKLVDMNSDDTLET